MYLSAKSGERFLMRNANQLLLDYDFEVYLRNIEKIINGKESIAEYMIDKYKVSKEKNIVLYDEFINKLSMKPYKEFYSNKVSKMQTYKSRFIELSILDQCRILIQILILFNTSDNYPDLHLIGGAKSFGEIKISKILNSNDDLYYVNTSRTGLFETVYRIGDL